MPPNSDVTQPGQAHPSLKKGMLDVGWDAMGEWLLPGSGALPHSLLLFLCSSALMESLINPLQDRIEDWKKTANQLDKDHAKGTGGTGWIRAGWLRCWAGSTLTALLHPQSTSEHAMRSRKSPLTPSSSRKRLAKVRGGLLGGAPTSPSAAPPARAGIPAVAVPTGGVEYSRGVLLPPCRKGGASSALGVAGRRGMRPSLRPLFTRFLCLLLSSLPSTSFL